MQKQTTSLPLRWLFAPLVLAALLSVSLFPAAAQDAAGTAPPAVQTISPERLSAYLEFYQYDKSLPLNAEERLIDETDAYRLYHVLYDSTHDQRVPALLMLPKSATGPRPCIFFMHGHGGKKDEVRSIFPLCLGLGYAAFSIDAQYHGERVNSGTEIFSQYIHRNRDAVIQTVVDARRGLDYLETRPDIDPARLGLIGGSMGGIMGSIFAGVDERLKAPILIVAGGDFGLMSRMSHLSSLEALRQKVSLPYDEIGPIMQPCEPLNFVGLISPRPVLFLNGLHDDIVPPEATKELFQAAGEPKEIHWYDAGHGLPREEIAARMIPWLEQNLSP